MATTSTGDPVPKHPLKEITQPFVDLVHAPRALWGINLGYFLEGWIYFGMLGYLAMHFSDFIFRGLPNADVHSHHMVMVLTAGITIAMFFLGTVADKKSIRQTLLWAFGLMLVGRILISGAPSVGLLPDGLWSTLHKVTMVGIVLIVIGYGMYQPAAYAGVRKFTSPKTAAMGFAMLYALMNLGGYMPTYSFLLRDTAGLGIVGTYWFYTALTLVALAATYLILTPRVEARAFAQAERERLEHDAARASSGPAAGRTAADPDPGDSTDRPPAVEATAALDLRHRAMTAAQILLAALGIGCGVYAIVAPLYYLFISGAGSFQTALLAFAGGALGCLGALGLNRLLQRWRVKLHRGKLAADGAADPADPLLQILRWLRNHPLANAKFSFFIFSLIPVQTLYVYNWLILPQYINRAHAGWIGEKFEIASNFNPILIFIAVPIITALTVKKQVYKMMIIGTFVMAAPAFLLALGTTGYLLFSYIILMTIGEAMWQPRFFQLAAEIAPKGRTGEYMGVAQFPWFLTKVIVPLYSGHMIARYVPAEGPQDPERMWLIFACIAMVSTILLLLGKRWVGKEFQTEAAN